jgi:hypothetical protein
MSRAVYWILAAMLHIAALGGMFVAPLLLADEFPSPYDRSIICTIGRPLRVDVRAMLVGSTEKEVRALVHDSEPFPSLVPLCVRYKDASGNTGMTVLCKDGRAIGVWFAPEDVPTTCRGALVRMVGSET